MIRAAVAALLLLPAAPALALTPEELWQAWQDQIAAWGGRIAATATPGPDGSLRLTDLRGGPDATPLPPGLLDEGLTLRPDGEGVRIDLGLPPLLVWPSPEGSGPETAFGQAGLTVRATGAPGALSYELAADRLSLGLFQPRTLATEPSNLAVEVRGLALTLPGQLDARGGAVARLSVEGYAMLQEGPDPIGGGPTVSATDSRGRLAAEAAWTLPPGTDWAALGESPTAWARALDAGLALRLSAEADSTHTDSVFRGWPFSYEIAQALGPSRGLLSVDRTGFRAEAEAEPGGFTVTLPDQGLGPVEGRTGPVSIAMALPFTAAPAEARYAIALGDLTVGDAAWDALDPGRHLPRGPLRLVIDIGARIGFDLPATLAAAEAGAEPPVPEVESVRIDALDIAVAGVTLTGTGSFTFEGEGAAQRPVGRAELRLDGLDRLLDGLVAAGWITAADATGARLGLAAAFRAGPAPDSRVLTFEARGAAGATLNGMPLPLP